MVDPAILAALAASISAMVDVIRIGKETYEEYYLKRQDDPALQQKIAALQTGFSTYSPEEIEAIEGRLENCRKRFITEGDGGARKTCLCSVLTDVRDGNGGHIPDDEWEEAYQTLNCAA